MAESRYAPPGEKMESEVSEEEWQVRVDLAAAYRLAWHFGWTDLIYNHITAKGYAE